MLKEAMEKLLSLAPINTVVLAGRTYTDSELELVTEPALSKVSLITLTGLIDLIQGKLDALDPASWVLHVSSHAEVSLLSRATDLYGRRTMLAHAKLDDGAPFPFGRFVDREEFVIGLQSRFVQTADQIEVLRITSNLQASTVAMSEEDGISQRTTVKQGVTLKETIIVKGRVSLRPYRTFREIEQPESAFIFRLRSQDGQVPECALFEADGGKWKLDSVFAIKIWLDSKNLDMPVIA